MSKLLVSAGLSATVASRLESFGCHLVTTLVDPATGVNRHSDPSLGGVGHTGAHGSVQPSSRLEGRSEGHQGRPRPAARVGGRAHRRRGVRRAADVRHPDDAAARGRRRRVHPPPRPVAAGRRRLRPQGRHPGLRHEPGGLSAAHARLLGAQLGPGQGRFVGSASGSTPTRRRPPDARRASARRSPRWSRSPASARSRATPTTRSCAASGVWLAPAPIPTAAAATAPPGTRSRSQPARWGCRANALALPWADVTPRDQPLVRVRHVSEGRARRAPRPWGRRACG